MSGLFSKIAATAARALSTKGPENTVGLVVAGKNVVTDVEILDPKVVKPELPAFMTIQDAENSHIRNVVDEKTQIAKTWAQRAAGNSSAVRDLE